MSSNGRTSDFGSENLGSNPSAPSKSDKPNRTIKMKIPSLSGWLPHFVALALFGASLAILFPSCGREANVAARADIEAVSFLPEGSAVASSDYQGISHSDFTEISAWGYWSISDAADAISEGNTNEYNSFFCNGVGFSFRELEGGERLVRVRDRTITSDAEGVPLLFFARMRFENVGATMHPAFSFENYYYYVNREENRNCISEMGLASEIERTRINEPIAPRSVKWGQWILFDRIHDKTMAKEVVNSYVGRLFNARIVPDEVCNTNVVLGPFDTRERARQVQSLIDYVRNMHFFDVRNVNDPTLNTMVW